MKQNHAVLCFKTSDMKNIFLFCLSFVIALSSCSQNSKQRSSASKDVKVGGGCEGCEAIYETPVDFALLNEVDTLPDFNEPGPKIEISGVIFKPDGKTPAPGVILYAVRGGLTAGEVLGRTQGNWGWIAFYALFVVSVAIHVPIGMRNILIEWGRMQRRSASLACLAFGLLLLFLGLRAVVAVGGLWT